MVDTVHFRVTAQIGGYRLGSLEHRWGQWNGFHGHSIQNREQSEQSNNVADDREQVRNRKAPIGGTMHVLFYSCAFSPGNAFLGEGLYYKNHAACRPLATGTRTIECAKSMQLVKTLRLTITAITTLIGGMVLIVSP